MWLFSLDTIEIFWWSYKDMIRKTISGVKGAHMGPVCGRQ